MDSKKLSEKVILEILKKNNKTLKDNNVKKIGLFGSFARGEQKKNSDIDFLIEFDLSKFDENFKGLYESFLDLSDYFESIFERKIEIITKESLSPYIKPYIEKDIIWYET